MVAAERAQQTQAAIVAALNAAAERIEEITRQLNQTVQTGARRGVGLAVHDAVAALHCAGGAAECDGNILPGPYDPEGSCPWPGPWVRTYGAHLLM